MPTGIFDPGPRQRRVEGLDADLADRLATTADNQFQGLAEPLLHRRHCVVVQRNRDRAPRLGFIEMNTGSPVLEINRIPTRAAQVCPTQACRQRKVPSWFRYCGATSRRAPEVNPMAFSAAD